MKRGLAESDRAEEERAAARRAWCVAHDRVLAEDDGHDWRVIDWRVRSSLAVSTLNDLLWLAP